jgi:demethylmenaquinone methyltransferase/2-methoxy-6-polyprenyl-1,4-benzoquinol methylase
MVGPTGVVVAVDPSEGMLAEARKAGVRDTRVGRGEQLPVGDGEFDILTMGYALRHVEDLVVTFREYLRALRPGGRVLLLEISRPEGRVQYHVLKFYLKHVVPAVTRVVRRSADAQELMRYYWDTIEACVPPADIQAALTAAGFTDVRRHVLNGMFSEYSAVKIGAVKKNEGTGPRSSSRRSTSSISRRTASTRPCRCSGRPPPAGASIPSTRSKSCSRSSRNTASSSRPTTPR